MAWIEAHVAEIWFLIIGFFVLYYAVTDGYDLGIGMFALFTKSEKERGVMMTSIQSVWQDNQTWLVVLGGMLFGAFPLFFSIALSALYIPMVIMLVGLIFRGMALEFRDHSKNLSLWSLLFGIGSLTAALCQGFALGGIFYGLPMAGDRFAGNMWSWLSPYSILFTLGVVSGYAMLGANYLILKTDGDTRWRSKLYSSVASIFTLMISAAIYIWTIVLHPYMAQKWLTLPSLFHVAVFPVLAFFACLMSIYSLRTRSDFAPFAWNVIFVFCAFVGLSIGFYPYIIPNMMTIQTAASSSPKTLIFMLIVVLILLPVILAYIGYKHWVFRGKVQIEERYGD